jgi:hypothetical protein
MENEFNYRCGLGGCLIIAMSPEHIMVRTNTEWIVGSAPCLTAGFVEWHWGHYFNNYESADKLFKEYLSKEN